MAKRRTKKTGKARRRGRSGTPAPAGGAPLLSACLIAKDEEAYLPACLEALAAFVDEIVVADTGSTDRTPDIARRLARKVLEVPWAGDFSQARNASLAAASGRWILVVDADEVIHPRDGARLRRFLPAAPERAYSLLTRNYTREVGIVGWTADDGRYPDLNPDRFGYWPSIKVRLFRNLPEIRFEGRVHELVEPALDRMGAAYPVLDVPVHHFGPLAGKVLREKEEHYLELGMEKLAERPDDPKAHFELGSQAFRLERYGEAERLLRECLRLDPAYPEARRTLCSCLLKRRAFAEALEVAEGAPEEVAADPHFLNLLGVCHVSLGRFDEGERAYLRALERRPDLAIAMMNLGRLMEARQDFEAAAGWYRKVLDVSPAHHEARYRMAKAHIALGRLREGLLLFQEVADAAPEFHERIQADLRALEASLQAIKAG
ncbi:tetratricopeptide repeat protein, partial [Dissulfurirhabdus thermomarina]